MDTTRRIGQVFAGTWPRLFVRCALVALVAAAAALPFRATAQTTFSNTTTILLPNPPGTGSVDNTVPGEPGSLYPSAINVSGLGTSISKLTVTINDFRHTAPDDIDMLLVGPQGQKMIIWSDVGGFSSTCGADFDFLACNNTTTPGPTGITVTLDDAATLDLSQAPTFTTGTYKPTNVGGVTDKFPSPAPAAPYSDPRPNGTATFTSVFNGTNPNGTWRLYVIDDSYSATGRIMGGWSITITTTTGGGTPAATTTTITGDSPDPSDIGQAVTVTYTVTSAGGTPAGNVTVSDGVNSCTATVAAGQCAITLNTPGSRPLTASYAATTSFAASSSGSAPHQVRYNTTTAITADTPDPSTTGQAVAVSYTVAPTAAGGPAPAGTVTVSDGVSSCSGTVAAGSCSVALTTTGSRPLIATYGGDPGNKGSTSASAAHQVNAGPVASITTITGDTPDPSDIGAPVTVTYLVTGAGGTPTGNVTVADGFNSCTASVAAGQCTIASLSTPGARTLTATYSGDANFLTSSGTTAHQVRYNTTTSIAADTPDPSVPGQSVAVSYTVSFAGPSPTGNVTVSDGVSACTASAAAGVCNVALSTLGARTLTATYAGDGFNKGSTSAGAPHQVNTAPPGSTITTILSDTPDPSNIGQAVTVTWSVTGNGGTPTGTVTVADGFNSCTASVSAGQCTISSLTAPGDRTLTATYSGDANFSTSSTTTAHRVRYDTVTTLANHTPNPSTSAQPVTVTFSVAATLSGGPAATGNVTVSDGAVSCTGTVAAGSCTLTLTTSGTRTLTATYAGDGYNKGSASAVAAHTVTLPVPDLTITKSHQGVFVPGQTGATYTVTVSNVGNGASNGAVGVSDTLPSGLTATSITGAGWSCSQPAGPCTRLDALAADASYPPITLTVIVAANAPASVTNVATVSGGSDSNPNNNSASDVTAIGGGTVYTLTAASTGSGAGTIASQDGGINCGALCTGVYVAGSVVTLTATPAVGKMFNGWTGACLGLSTCTITMGANRSVSATFAPATNGTKYLDIDNNSLYEPLADALLVTRYLFGLTGSALVNGVLGQNAQRTVPAEVLTYLNDIRPRLDADGNGQADALTDGLLILRYMLGMRGTALVQNALGTGATRDASQVAAYLQTLLP